MKKREWTIFDGHSARPTISGPPIAYAETVKVREVLPGEITLTREELREAIMKTLRDFTKEMEGYSYFGSNPGVSEDDYEYVVEDVLKGLFGEEGSEG